MACFYRNVDKAMLYLVGGEWIVDVAGKIAILKKKLSAYMSQHTLIRSLLNNVDDLWLKVAKKRLNHAEINNNNKN